MEAIGEPSVREGVGVLDPAAAGLEKAGDLPEDIADLVRGQAAEGETGDDRSEAASCEGAREGAADLCGIPADHPEAWEAGSKHVREFRVALDDNEFAWGDAPAEEGFGDGTGSCAEFDEVLSSEGGAQGGHAAAQFRKTGDDGADGAGIGEGCLEEDGPAFGERDRRGARHGARRMMERGGGVHEGNSQASMAVLGGFVNMRDRLGVGTGATIPEPNPPRKWP